MVAKAARSPLKQAQNLLAMQVILTAIGCVLLFLGFLMFPLELAGALLYASPFMLLAISAILVAYVQLSALKAEHRVVNEVPTPDS